MLKYSSFRAALLVTTALALAPTGLSAQQFAPSAAAPPALQLGEPQAYHERRWRSSPLGTLQ